MQLQPLPIKGGVIKLFQNLKTFITHIDENNK